MIGTKTFLAWSVIGVLLFGLLLPAPSPAASKSIVFIFDASGSMWGRVEGLAKIEVARNVMARLLADLPGDIEVGLVAYGHRRKGDCQDIEFVVPPNAGGAQAVAVAFRHLNPYGKTPLAASLTKTAEKLGPGTETNVVVISDGIETCGGDPCVVARTIREKGFKITIYVVAFDVSGDAVKQLECIAREGGGQYFQADNADGLTKALSAVKDHLVQGAPLPESLPQPQIPPVKSATQRIQVAGPGTVVISPAPWVTMPPRHWMLVDPETGAEIARSSDDSIRVKPGTYQIAWRQNEHASQDVTLGEVVNVEAGQKSVVPIQTGLKLITLKEVKPPYYWCLVDIGDQIVARFKGQLSAEVVPAGTYRLVWRQSEHGHVDVELGEVVVEAGKLNEHLLDFGIRVTLPEWLAPPYYFALKDEGGKQLRFKETDVQLISPGTYSLFWRQSEHGFSEVFWNKITVSEHGFTDITIDSGIQLLAGDAPKPYRVYAENLRTGSRAEMAESWGPMPLPPGSYKISLREKEHGGSTVAIVEELNIEKSQLVEIQF